MDYKLEQYFSLTPNQPVVNNPQSFTACRTGCASLCEHTAREDDAEKAPCCGTVAAAEAGAERLTCWYVATAGIGTEVSPAVLSSHCSIMTAVLELDG